MLAHVDMDAFYASVEVLDRPELAGRPVVVGGGRRGVVSAASYAARRFGVRSGMPMFQARKLCPQGVFLPVRMERYRQVSRRVMEVLCGFSPLVEQVSVDEAYLDLAGTEHLWGPPLAAGRAIKQAMRRATGLTCSVGLAPVRFLAKIASDRDKPDGLTLVDDLESFLATVRLEEVPGVGEKALGRLKAMGLSRLVEVRLLGVERLEASFGVWGRRLWELSWGRDEQGVCPQRPAKSISCETTLEQDTADRELLAAHLLGLCQKLCRRLRAKGLAGRTVVLKLKHADFRLVTRRRRLPAAAEVVEEVFPVARELLERYPGRGPFRLIGVGLADLTAGGGAGGELFGAEQRRRRRALGRAEDELARRFGEGALLRAGVLPALDRDPGNGHNEGES